MRSRSYLAAQFGAAVLLCAGSFPAPATGQALVTPTPIPSGSLESPENTMRGPEHRRLHSSCLLQGAPATEKFAIYLNQDDGERLGEFFSTLVINNASSVQSLTVQITYYTASGLVVPRTPVTIAPDGTHTELTTGFGGTNNMPIGPIDTWGSVRVTSTNGVSFVGAVIHNGYEGLDTFIDPNPQRGGAASMQQLQMSQDDATTLYWGPIPVSNNSGNAFYDGLVPMAYVINPESHARQIFASIVVFDANGTFVTTLTVSRTVLGYSAWRINELELHALQEYYGGSNFDYNYLVRVTTSDNLPLIGEGLMVDIDDDDFQFASERRFRIGSTMMANDFTDVLVNPDLTTLDNVATLTTYMGVMNVTGADVGPLTVSYFDNQGTLVGTDSFTQFLSGQSLRIGPGGLTPNYPFMAPGTGEFNGSCRVSSEGGGLVGWTMRVSEAGDPSGLPPGVSDTPGGPDTDPLSYWRRAWGEVMIGANGAEPGTGFDVLDPTQSGNARLVAAIAPLNWLRPIDPTPPFYQGRPGMIAWSNWTAPNYGPYAVQTYNRAGVDVSDFTLQPFAGVPFQASGMSYLDNTNAPLVSVFSDDLGAPRLETSSPYPVGICVIGGLLRGYPWGYSYPPPPYTGPGDTVP